MPNTSRFSMPYVIYLVILSGLIFAFHTELLVITVRVYLFATNNPKAERLLGDYYQNSAHLSTELAKGFYGNAMRDLSDELAKVNNNPQKIAQIKLGIGQLFQCGYGMPKNLPEAKRWYEEALQSTEHVDNQNPNLFALIKEIKNSIAVTNLSLESNSTPLCPYLSESEFIKNIFLSLIGK